MYLDSMNLPSLQKKKKKKKKVPENRGGIFCIGARTRTDILPYISLIPVFGYFMRGTSRGFC